MDKKQKTISKKGKKPVEETKKSEVQHRVLGGVVMSDKMAKTVVVKVTRYKEHSKYKKRYKVSKKYKAHDEKNEYKTGDKVLIQECRPMSKDKSWMVVKKVTTDKNHD